MTSFAIDRSTQYNPFLRWLRFYTGDRFNPFPQRGLPFQYAAMPLGYVHESLEKATADLWDWIPKLYALAVRPKTYMVHLGFMSMATGETPLWSAGAIVRWNWHVNVGSRWTSVPCQFRK